MYVLYKKMTDPPDALNFAEIPFELSGFLKT